MNPEIEKKAEECKQAIIEELQNKNIDKYDGKMGYQIQIMYAESTPIVKVMDIHLQFVIELKLITRQPHQKTFCKIFDESDFIENTLGFDNAFYKLRQLINQYKIGIKQKDSVIISESKTPEIEKKAEKCKQAIVEQLQQNNINEDTGHKGYQIQILYSESTKVIGTYSHFVIELKLIRTPLHKITICEIFDESDFIEETYDYNKAYYKLGRVIKRYQKCMGSEPETPEIDIIQDRIEKIKNQFKYEQDKIKIDHVKQTNSFVVTIMNEDKSIITQCILTESDFVITGPEHYFHNNPWMVKLEEFKSEHSLKTIKAQNISINIHPMDISQIYYLLDKIKQRNNLIDRLNQENKETTIRIESFLMQFIRNTDEQMPEWIDKMIETYQEKLQIVDKNKSRDMGDY